MSYLLVHGGGMAASSWDRLVPLLNGMRVLDQIDPQVRVCVEESIGGGIYHQEREPAREILCNDLDAEQSEWVLDRIVLLSAIAAS